MLASGVVGPSKSRAKKVQQVLREACDVACYMVVRMTPLSKHVGQRFPPTPVLSSLARKLWKAEDAVLEGTLPRFEAGAPSFQRRRMTYPRALNDQSSPWTKLHRRRMRRTQSLQGWTPQPLDLSPSNSQEGASDAEPSRADSNSSPQIGKVLSIASRLPSVLELGRIYCCLAQFEEDGSFGIAAMERAVEELEARFGFGLRKTDAPRLLAFVRGKEGSVTRQGFTSRLRDLLCTIHTAQDKLSLAQLRVVVASAFDRFDTNNDDEICLEEFSAALKSMGLSLAPKEILLLHEFLASSPEYSVTKSASLKRDSLKVEIVSPEEQCRKAMERALKTVSQRAGFCSASKIAKQLYRAMSSGDTMQRARRVLAVLCGMSKNATCFADTVELTGGLAITGLALAHFHLHGHDEASLSSVVELANQVDDVGQSLKDAMGDLFQNGPTTSVLLSGVLGAAQALPQETVALDENEALLYARNFHNMDCSQGLFQKLLILGGFRWCRAEEGEFLNSSSKKELKILVRGRCSSRKIDLPAGAVIGPGMEAVATENSTYAAWDWQRLNAAARQDQRIDVLVKDLLSQCKEDSHSPGGSASPTYKAYSPTIFTPGSWLSPIVAAIELQAKRKGLLHCSQLSVCLQQVLAKPDVSLKEKLGQCGSMIWNEIGEIKETLEAATEMLGVCSVLAAWIQNSAATSPDDLLQLSPLLILFILGLQPCKK
eukprot:TRINITY_DN12933_c0_g1_i1.p1 TRINITY_DN12933_c0_g1~~TRINITY_DN12933_c0_g1_i1.p1  ORF type:complete len:803 (+),score=141.78 TRINITY_DN12933_c0_g1_i1:272-2410(+)